MHKSLLKNTFNIIFIFVTTSVMYSQITSDTADYVDVAPYDDRDSLFFFNPDDEDNYTIELTALTDTFDTYSYNWYRMTGDSATRLKTPFASGDSYKTINLDTLTQDQLGIELIVDSLTFPIDTFSCWVFKNTWGIHITKAKDGISVSKIECEYFIVNVTDSNRTKDYFDPWGNSRSYTMDKPELNWTTSSADSVELPNSYPGNSQISDFLMEDWYYYLYAVDVAGKEGYDTVFVEAIQPRAEIDTQSIAINPFYTEVERYADDENTAPMSIRVGHNSEDSETNTDSIQIKIFNDTDDDGALSEDDSVLKVFDTAIYALDENIYFEYEFQLPGTYGIELTAMRFWEKIKDVCYDKDDIVLIEIDEGTLLGGDDSSSDSVSLPNAFSVSPGEYRFHFDDKSITYFEIVIYNRYGYPVHQFEGNIRDWPGWDGRRRESNSYVATGVYFYVIKRLDILRDFTYYLDGDYYEGNDEFEEAFYGKLDQSQYDKDGRSGYTDYNRKKGTIAGMVHVFNRE